MASYKPRQPTKSVQDIHAVMNPEEICADLEKLYASRTNKENQSVNTTTTPVNNDRQSQVLFCGVEAGPTSSVFHRLYTAGASSISRPPRKIGKPEPDSFDSVPLSLPLRLCGVDRSTTSSDIFTGIFAAGVEAVVESQDQFWKPHETDESLGMKLQKEKAQKEHELRVIQIAEDLKKEAPHIVKRENLIPMIKQSEKRYREKRRQQRRGCTMEAAGNGNATKRIPTVTFNIDEDSDSERYPSDIDEFLDYARMVVEEQNSSFESTSYEEFEKALRDTIRTHFLDYDDDDDSMTSMSSYSGLDTESKSLQTNTIENKPASAVGIVGTNTRKYSLKTKISQCHNSDSEKLVAALCANKATPCNVATDSLSITPKVDDGEASHLTAPATEDGFIPTVEEKICQVKIGKPNSEVDDDSILNLTEMMSVSTASHLNSTQVSRKDCSVASPQSMNSPSTNMASDIDESSAASDATFTTGSSFAVIRRKIESENDTLDKFQYNPLDNSLVSETSFKADSKIQKLPFRKEVPPLSNAIAPSLEHSETETPHSTLTDGMKRTVENLALLLAEGNNNPTHKLKGVDRDVVLQKLHDVAPHLYKAVLARMETEHAKNDGHQHVNISSISPRHLEMRDASLASRGTVGPEKTRDHVSDTNYHKGNLTGALDPSKQPAAKKAQNSRSAVNTSFGDSKPPLSPLRASSPITKVSLDEALELASLEFDISRGSFWSEVLDVNEGPIPDSGEDLDPSDELPSISFDDHELTIPFLRQVQKSVPSKLGDEDTLDTMIEEFLATKIDRLNSLMRERQIILAHMERVFAELQRTPASLLRKSGFAGRGALVRSLSNDDNNCFPRVQRGRALIRKIQRKRQAMIIARRREEDNIPYTAEVLKHAQSIPQGLQAENSPVQRDESTSSRRHDNVFQFEDFLTTPLENTASVSPPSDTSRNAIRQVREKRKMIRKKLGRSTMPVLKKALHESMDSAVETEDSVCTGSTGTRIISPPPKQPMVITIRKKQKHKERNYKPLPDQNLSFNCSQEMKGDDILQALAPPSPESPIRDYRLDTKSLLADDIACLFEVASGDLSGDEGRVLVFSDTEASDNSENMRLLSQSVTDDLDPFVSQSSTTIEPSWDDEDTFMRIHKKDSPTSIADFFNETDTDHTDKVAAAYERARNANYLDEDDQFVHTAMDLFMLRDDDEEEEDQRFDNVEFFSRNRFLI